MDEEKLYIVLSENQTDEDGKPVMYCFEESCLDSVRTEGMMPDSLNLVNVDTIEQVTSWDDIDKTIKLNGTTIKCGEDKLYKNCKPIEFFEGADNQAQDATYYEPGKTAEVKGLEMCVAVLAIDQRRGIVALHYVTGQSGMAREREDAKLDRLIELTKEHNFQNYEVQVADYREATLQPKDKEKQQADITRIIEYLGSEDNCIEASNVRASDGKQHYERTSYSEEKTTEEEDRRAKRW